MRRLLLLSTLILLLSSSLVGCGSPGPVEVFQTFADKVSVGTVDSDEARQLLNDPPETNAELEEKLEDAYRYLSDGVTIISSEQENEVRYLIRYRSMSLGGAYTAAMVKGEDGRWKVYEYASFEDIMRDVNPTGE